MFDRLAKAPTNRQRTTARPEIHRNSVGAKKPTALGRLKKLDLERRVTNPAFDSASKPADGARPQRSRRSASKSKAAWAVKPEETRPETGGSLIAAYQDDLSQELSSHGSDCGGRGLSQSQGAGEGEWVGLWSESLATMAQRPRGPLEQEHAPPSAPSSAPEPAASVPSLPAPRPDGEFPVPPLEVQEHANARAPPTWDLSEGWLGVSDGWGAELAGMLSDQDMIERVARDKARRQQRQLERARARAQADAAASAAAAAAEIVKRGSSGILLQRQGARGKVKGDPLAKKRTGRARSKGPKPAWGGGSKAKPEKHAKRAAEGPQPGEARAAARAGMRRGRRRNPLREDFESAERLAREVTDEARALLVELRARDKVRKEKDKGQDKPLLPAEEAKGKSDPEPKQQGPVFFITEADNDDDQDAAPKSGNTTLPAIRPTQKPAPKPTMAKPAPKTVRDASPIKKSDPEPRARKPVAKPAAKPTAHKALTKVASVKPSELPANSQSAGAFFITQADDEDSDEEDTPFVGKHNPKKQEMQNLGLNQMKALGGFSSKLPGGGRLRGIRTGGVVSSELTQAESAVYKRKPLGS